MMADKFNPKDWPNVNMAFQNVQPKQQSIVIELLRFIGWGLAILALLRLLNWVA